MSLHYSSKTRFPLNFKRSTWLGWTPRTCPQMSLYKMLTKSLQSRFRATPNKFYFALHQHNKTTPFCHNSGKSNASHDSEGGNWNISAFRNKKKAPKPRAKCWQTWQMNISTELEKTFSGQTVSVKEHWPILCCLAFTGFSSVMNLPKKVRRERKKSISL